jgi:hypothetical protein
MGIDISDAGKQLGYDRDPCTACSVYVVRLAKPMFQERRIQQEGLREGLVRER